MSRSIDKQIENHLAAILAAAADLIFEVGIPPTAAELESGPRIVQIALGECLRRIGEAVAQIDAIAPAWLGERFPELPWREIKATRNRLTHHYWTVDFTILHHVAAVDLALVTSPIATHLGVTDPYLQDPSS